MCMRTLAYYLEKLNIINNDVRYMPANVVDELIEATSACRGTKLERLYWLRNNIDDYPRCKHCDRSLSSASFINGVVGYRTYCCRTCQRNSKEYKEKYRDTCLKKYGVEHSFSAAVVQEKRTASNIDRYGSSHPHKWGSEKFKSYMKERFGVENSLQDPLIRAKVSEALRKGYVENKLEARLDEIKEQENVTLFSAYTGHDQPLLWKHDTCNETFYSNIADGKVPSCPKCNGKSKPEYQLYKHVCELVGEHRVIRNDRSLIKPLELDIYLPEHKLAFELNGMFWHSELFMKPGTAKTYHSYKSELCKARGVQLIQIFDIEWYEKNAIILDKLNHLLGKSTKHYARNLNVVDVPASISSEFLTNNHLQGKDVSAVKLGLVDDNGYLYSLMTFTKARFSKSYEWELSRFTNTIGNVVVGGASRLLTAFEQLYKPKSLVTYADARFSSGKVYDRLGFQLSHLSKPNYWYVKSGAMLSRYQAQKHKLRSVLGESFDESLSERANMNANGWYAVYDCGNYVYFKRYM